MWSARDRSITSEPARRRPLRLLRPLREQLEDTPGEVGGTHATLSIQATSRRSADFSPHVRDVVAAYHTFWSSAGAPGQRYNICSGEGRTIGSVLDELIERAAMKVEVRVDPSKLRPVDTPRQIGSAAKLRALGWQPRWTVGDALVDVLETERRSLIVLDIMRTPLLLPAHVSSIVVSSARKQLLTELADEPREARLALPPRLRRGDLRRHSAPRGSQLDCRFQRRARSICRATRERLRRGRLRSSVLAVRAGALSSHPGHAASLRAFPCCTIILETIRIPPMPGFQAPDRRHPERRTARARA